MDTDYRLKITRHAELELCTQLSAAVESLEAEIAERRAKIDALAGGFVALILQDHPEAPPVGPGGFLLDGENGSPVIVLKADPAEPEAPADPE
jgi:hypothetical protein